MGEILRHAFLESFKGWFVVISVVIIANLVILYVKEKLKRKESKKGFNGVEQGNSNKSVNHSNSPKRR